MPALLIGMAAVLFADQSVKLGLRRGLRDRSVAIGALGRVALVRSPMLWRRAWPGLGIRVLWCVWGIAFSACAGAAVAVPPLGPWLGLLAGGALSHALETTMRGAVTDYVHLRLWPAFDLADVVLTVGAVGLLLQLAAVLS